jgi:hypothetical protein
MSSIVWLHPLQVIFLLSRSHVALIRIVAHGPLPREQRNLLRAFLGAITNAYNPRSRKVFWCADARTLYFLLSLFLTDKEFRFGMTSFSSLIIN